MRIPSLQEKAQLVALAQAKNEEGLQALIEELGLPEEVAARWYAYIVDYPDGVQNIQEINHLLNLSWAGQA
uniref:Uncharacterized protein n=1 Tax=feces metagenome TaxID=1861841 RepID=A0A7M2QMB5_9ZZZZ